MNLTTKTAQLIEDTKKMIESVTSAKNEAETKGEKDHYREMISEGRNLIKGIISFKNELKELHYQLSNYPSVFHSKIGKLIQEIEEVENAKINN